MKTTIKFLGSGSAFALADENYHSNILITRKAEKDEQNFLFDCGTSIPESLNKFGFIPQDIHSIYISHLHADHVGGLEYMAFKTYFETYKFGKNAFGTMKPKLYGDKDVLNDAWEHTLKGGLEAVQGRRNILTDYFDVVGLSENENFNILGLEIGEVRTLHAISDKEVEKAFGVYIKDENQKKVYISGDSNPFQENKDFPIAKNIKENVFKKIEDADIIFQDSEFANYPNSVHAQFHQLCELGSEIKKKMWLYHYKLNDMSYEELNQEVLEAGFAGLIKRGQEFIL